MAKFIELTSKDVCMGNFLVNVDHIAMVYKSVSNEGAVLMFSDGNIEKCIEPYHEVKAKIREAGE